MTAEFRAPAPLEKGDVIGVFAGSSPFDATLGWRGLGWLAEQYRLVFDRGVFSVDGYLAGNDERRQNELQRLLDHDEIKAIVAMRGGYGLSRIVANLDWSRFCERPRWIVGFSDVTALHVETSRLAVASVHGPMVAALGRGDERTRTQWQKSLAGRVSGQGFERLTTRVDGSAKGVLIGGNLTMLHACAAAGRLRVPKGAIVLLEDVTERPYRIDRMLSTLIAGGYFAEVGAIVLGDFTDCGAARDGVTVERVFEQTIDKLGVPVLSGLPVGHALRNDAVVLGATVYVDSKSRTMVFE